MKLNGIKVEDKALKKELKIAVKAAAETVVSCLGDEGRYSDVKVEMWRDGSVIRFGSYGKRTGMEERSLTEGECTEKEITDGAEDLSGLTKLWAVLNEHNMSVDTVSARFEDGTWRKMRVKTKN